MKEQYLDLTKLIERLHRRFLDVLRAELNRLGIKEINGVQALLLANIGEEDIVIRDLVERGYYQGSNVSYNIKKLVDFGYLEQERVEHDRRSVRVRLTQKSKDLVVQLRQMEERNAAALAEEGLDADEVKAAFKTLRRLERTWADYIQYGEF
ncbi:MarR family winged helix-turn-helix transcriptional regulator [Magnetospira sp. QH-2]|uniref:MarR family winged helix-turn-helix transcriptional regulator n=1 Tax=Magnetospira sp. (strain QH-2) TaxID=1288970 RepID=UPI0003E81537|nr:MarR family transcriptional regulator [Magnetospira sp. QH-2]CCQ73557.1 Transcriptional regulator, MarR family [Magnetospira sp. QH-2]